METKYDYCYNITVHAAGGPERFVIEADSLAEALDKLACQCVETDNTGVIFDLEDADLEELATNPNFYTIAEVYGIVLESFTERRLE